MRLRPDFRRKPKPVVDPARLLFLALPKNRSPEFMPDRPSTYWLDYLLDETPRSITNPEELQQYYRKFFLKTPRLEKLSRPRTAVEVDPYDLSISRPVTAYGIQLSALNYEPSERIKRLARPKAKLSKSAHCIPLEKKPFSGTNIQQTGSRPSLPYLSKRVSSSSTKADLGRGDFYSRSKYRMTDRSLSRGSGSRNRSHRTTVRDRRQGGEGMQNRNISRTQSNSRSRQSLQQQSNSRGDIPKSARKPPMGLADGLSHKSYVDMDVRALEILDENNNEFQNRMNPELFMRKNPLTIKYLTESDHLRRRKPFK